MLVFSLLLLSFVYLFRLRRTHKLKLPPSPPKLPIIGNLHQLGTFHFRSLKKLSDKYGPLMLVHFGNVPTLVVSTAEMAHEITKNHDAIFADRPKTSAGDVLFFGRQDIAFCPYGEYWRQAKKVCVLQLLNQKRVQHFEFVRREETTKLVQKLRHACAEGSPVDLSEMLTTISSNIVSRSALGTIYDNESGRKSNSSGDLVRTGIDLVGSFSFKDSFPCLGWLDVLTGLNNKVKKASKELHGFLDQVIEEHIQASKSQDKADDRKDIVDILLQLERNRMLTVDFTRERMKAILMDMFIGGTDTTATTMEWTMAELMKNPSIMKKAQEEVRRVVGNKLKVDESDLDQMTYLKCIVKETLRHHSGIIPRQTTTSIKLEGYDIPSNTKVLINAWGIQRDPRIWEKPDDYIPERFIDNPTDFKSQDKKYIPFGFGRRVCPGISFALKEVEYVLANLLFLFDWKLPDGQGPEDLDMSEVFYLVNRKKESLMIVPTVH
uniref:Cytochrome P450 n=1 Tax=Manihot esculenta TaxID=3983 RepID=A0A2C9UJ86_MANES